MIQAILPQGFEGGKFKGNDQAKDNQNGHDHRSGGEQQGQARAVRNSQRSRPSSAQLKKPATTIKAPAASPISLFSVRDRKTAVGERASRAAASKQTRWPNCGAR